MSDSGSTTAEFDATALILAGGRGERMGVEKPLVQLDGLSLVDRVKELLRPLFAEVIVVTNRPDLYGDQDVKVIRDQVPYQGPLAGIYAGIAASARDLSFVVASDMPFASVDVIRLLADHLDGVQVVVVETPAGIEPLFGFYAKSCLAAISRHLEAGDRKPTAFYPDVSVGFVPEAEVRRLDPDLKSLFNVNTMADLTEARRMMGQVH